MVKIKELATAPPKGVKREKLEKETKKLAKRLADLQAVMNAEGKYSMLVVTQGMDASGKDGAVKNVFKYCSHIGIHLNSFKKPSKEEMGHDFLWRAHKITPLKGEIALWNRSHYEDVLAVATNNICGEEYIDCFRRRNCGPRLQLSENGPDELACMTGSHDALDYLVKVE